MTPGLGDGGGGIVVSLCFYLTYVCVVERRAPDYGIVGRVCVCVLFYSLCQPFYTFFCWLSAQCRLVTLIFLSPESCHALDGSDRRRY